MSNLRCVCGHWEDSHVKITDNNTASVRQVCYQCECTGFFVSQVETALKEWSEEAHKEMYEKTTGPVTGTKMERKLVPANPDIFKVVEEGKKFDGDKLRLDLIPTVLLRGVAWILTFGAVKYGDRNWEQGILYHRVWGALLRHLMSWYEGEVNDPESGKPHLWHAACNLSFLMHFEENRDKYESFDDRPNL